MKKWVPALLVLAFVACGKEAARKQAEGDVRAAIAELKRTSAVLASARGDESQAKQDLSFAADQQLKSEDETGKLWWEDTVRQRQRGLRQTELAAVAALEQHMRSGRRYVETERAYEKVHGKNFDVKSAGDWARMVEEYEKKGGKAPGQDGEERGLRLGFWAAVAAGCGLLAGMLLLQTASGLSVLGRLVRGGSGAGPAIQVRAEAAEKVDLPLLAGKYRLHKVIGRGGCGRVWEAYENSTLRRVAVKQMASIAGVENAKIRDLYLREAETLVGLRHPSIVSFIEVLLEKDEAYLVFEFVSGKTLQHMLATDKKLPWAQVRSVFIPVAQALGHAHSKGLIHRDLKPANIMICDDASVRVMDFGIARAVGSRVGDGAPRATSGDPILARTETVVGTPGYMSPDAYEGLVWPGIDIFACGVCIYESLTGHVPFGYGPWSPSMASHYIGPAAYSPGLPRGVESLVARLLAPDRGKRVQTAKEMESLLLLCGVV